VKAVKTGSRTPCPSWPSPMSNIIKYRLLKSIWKNKEEDTYEVAAST
jgi:hypothetical protein